VVDTSFFSDFVDVRRWIDLGLRKHGDVPGRRVTSICVLLGAVGIFIESQSLVDDGVFLNLAMVDQLASLLALV
jgi:hypothetical protein